MENNVINDLSTSKDIIKKEMYPYSISILVFGIISIVTCCNLGFIPAIVSLVLYSNGKKKAKKSNIQFSEKSFKMAKAGNTCAIIGLIVSLVCTIIIAFIIWIMIAFFPYECNY